MFKRSALANFLLPCGERSLCINIGTSVLALVGSVSPIRRIDVNCMIFTGQARHVCGSGAVNYDILFGAA